MTTTLTNLTGITGDELVALATRIRDWQEARKYSDNELLRRCPGLGSTKTFTRICKGDLAELDLDRWLSEYRAVWALIESLTGREQNEEDIYEDLTAVVQLRRALVEILEETSIRRVVLLEGDSGLGKSCALSHLQRKYGQRILIVEATIVWADNPNAFLGAILDSLGVRDQPAAKDDRLRMVVRKFREHRVALAIDEAHDMGPRCLGVCKTLINQTPCEIILLAWPTLWRRLERAAYEEVKQLMGNRIAERIKLSDTRGGKPVGLREADVKKLLQRRLGVDDSKCVAAFMAESPPRGNLSFVAAVCKRLLEQEHDGAPTPEAVLAVIETEKARR